LNKLHVTAGLPTVLIWGDDDGIIPVAHAYAAHDALTGSRLEVLEGVGHFPHAEAPTAVVDILETFIASTTPQGHLDSRVHAGYVPSGYNADLVRQTRPVRSEVPS